MASADLGGPGPSQSEPAVIEWHWYYHVPGFAGWALIVALLVVVKENRHRSAWLILIPFLLLSEVLWPWTVRLLALSSGAERRFGLPLQWLLVAWTALWLWSPWLARRRPVLAVLFVAALVSMVGVAGQLGVFERVYFRGELSTYLVAASALPAAFVLTRWSCRKSYGPRRFLAWLGLWLVVGVLAGWGIDTVSVFASLPAERLVPALLSMLPSLGVVSLCFAGVLYLVNLPFMYLALHCPVYRERFHKVLRLPACAEPAASGVPSGSERRDNRGLDASTSQ